MARPKGDHETRKAKMAEATLRVVARHGLKAASLANIASELGCTTGTLQHYFPNKSELLRFAKDTLFDRARSQMINSTKGRNGLERLRAMASVGLPQDADRLLMWRIYTAFVGGAVGDAETMLLQRRQDVKDIQILRDEILFLQEQGHIPAELDAATEAFALMCVLDGIGVNAAISSKAMSRRLQKEILNNYLDRTFSCNE